MDQRQQVKRFCRCMILYAVMLRLAASGLPEMLWNRLKQVDIALFLTDSETGRDVRFSASREVFSDHFRESPPPVGTDADNKPAFSAEDAAAVELYYGCSLRPELDTLLTAPLEWDLVADAPTVLILHTHTTESYTRSGEPYVEVSDYRTLDEHYNMLSIGDRVAEVLEDRGIRVVHDRQVHDYPSYNGSYTHARKEMQTILEKYPSILLVLDLHRDASGTPDRQLRTLAQVDGASSAQLMLVVGTGSGGLTHPDWQKNLSLALKLQILLERQNPGIMRPLSLRSQRFNQDLSPGALLVEVGAAGNSHAEALTAAQELAEGIAILAAGAEIR